MEEIIVPKRHHGLPQVKHHVKWHPRKVATSNLCLVTRMNGNHNVSEDKKLKLNIYCPILYSYLALIAFKVMTHLNLKTLCDKVCQ